MLGTSRLYRECRKFSVTCPIWATAIRHTVTPDEIYDLTLVSQRVYGNRDDYLVVMAAAGLNRLDQPLQQVTLVLPTASQLAAIKAKVGYTDTYGTYIPQ